MKTILMFQWFNCADEARSAELISCVEHNLTLGFDEVIILNDSTEPRFLGECVTNVTVNRRITFRDFTDVAGDPENRGSLVVLTNTDIKLARDFLRVAEVMQSSDFLCFARYEAVTGALAKSPWCTQDVWAVIAQPIHRSVTYQAAIPLGMPGCEIRFAEMMFNVGYSVFNPCLDIKNLHVHANQSPHQDENRIYGAYLFTPACTLDEVRRHAPKEHAAPRYLTKFLTNRVFGMADIGPAQDTHE